MKRKDDLFEYKIFWICNLCQLVNCLKQFSNDPVFRKENTSKQNDQCLKNLNLSEFHTIIKDLADKLLQELIKQFETKLGPIISNRYIHY